VKITSYLIILAPLFLVNGCDYAKPSPQGARTPQEKIEIQNFISKVKSDLIFVPGGEFLMGDFGEQQFGMPIDPNQDSKPLHKVRLTSYSISKFKITNEQYQLYLKENNLQERKVKESLQRMWGDMNKTPKTPANIDWNEADKYCLWLAKVTNLSFQLPTEAQWEYAARSRGQFVVQATNNGKVDVKKLSEGDEKGNNVPTSYDRKIFSKESGTKLDIISSLPVDAYPPNWIGVYDMTANGFEWVDDWYDPQYYKN
jgi:formylglycine-generating enzyme required for sulfatase activity